MSTDLLFGQLQTSSPELLFGDGGGSVPVAPSATDLIFERPASTSTPNLVFGEDGETVAPDVSVTLTATLPPLTAYIVITPRVLVQVVATLPPMTCTATALYKSEAQRPTVADVGGVWQVATTTTALSTPAHQNTAPLPTGIQGAHQEAQPTATHIAHHLPDVLTPSDVPHVAHHQDAAQLGHQAAIWQQHGIPTVARTAARHQDAHGLRYSARTQSQDGIRRATQRCTHWQTGQRQTAWRKARHQVADPLHIKRTTKNKDGMPPPPGISLIPSPPAPQPCYTPNPHLLFAEIAALNGHLVFVCGQTPAPPPMPEGGTVIPIRRVYFVINNIALHLASAGTPVPCLSMGLSIDTSSWTWGFDASLPAKSEPLLMPVGGQPVELIATINDTEFKVFAESISRERSFGNATIRVSGRGRNAVLAAPYAPISYMSNGVPRTAQQLMADVLTVNGVPLGWAIDWGIEDWLVPAGGFVHQGSYMDGLNTIAQAVGAYILPHPSQNLMRVRHLYPAAQWDWGSITPDITLPVDAVQRESVRWVDKPAYNRVFVAGQDVGIVGQVTRGGTAGDFLAPMIVDRLITHADAARQRGRAVLSDSGRQIDSTLRLPLGVTGLIEPGTFVQYKDGPISRMGLVRSTQIEAGFPDVWQVLGVKSHA